MQRTQPPLVLTGTVFVIENQSRPKLLRYKRTLKSSGGLQKKTEITAESYFRFWCSERDEQLLRKVDGDNTAASKQRCIGPVRFALV